MKLFDKTDPLYGLRGFLILDGFVRLAIWSGAMTLTLLIVARLGAWPDASPRQPAIGAAWSWAWFGFGFVLVYNPVYVLLLLALRLPIPQPKAGRYLLKPGAKIDKNLIYSCLIATLTKARYEAPFPGFLVFHAFNLPPVVWLSSRIFGPRSRSCYVLDPNLIDPHLTTIGRNVVFGFGSVVGAHYQEPDHVVIGRTVIEDDVLIGAGSFMSCVHIKRGATIGAASLLLPGTVVGEGEYWSGNPARRRTRPGAAAAAGAADAASELEGSVA